MMGQRGRKDSSDGVRPGHEEGGRQASNARAEARPSAGAFQGMGLQIYIIMPDLVICSLKKCFLLGHTELVS